MPNPSSGERGSALIMVPVLAGVAALLLAFSLLLASALYQQARLTQVFETCALAASRALSSASIYLDSTARISAPLASQDTTGCLATMAGTGQPISWTVSEPSPTSIRIAGSQPLSGPLTGLFALFGAHPRTAASATAAMGTS